MHSRTNHAWINIWKGGRGVSNQEGCHIILSIEFSEFQSLDIFETLDETAPF